MLTRSDVTVFLADGYVAVRQAVPAATVQACQDVIWSELGQRGVRRDDPATWTAPVVRIPCPEGGPFAEAGVGTVPALREACDQLIGAGRWRPRADVGGTIPVRFPSEDDPGDAGWHIESSYEVDGQLRVNLNSRARGLLALYLLTDGAADDVPTRLRPGSHLDVPPILGPGGDAGLDWSQAAQRAAAASSHRRTEYATGRAGDVFLCHPFLVHAASWPHRGRRPRMIAQPAVALHGQFPLDEDAPSPVELAILTGLTPARTA